MTDIDVFLRDAAAMAGSTVDDVLARVLHVEDGMLAAVVASMDEATRGLVLRLDREIRVRNPGLHYVMRGMYVGYRREEAVRSPYSPKGERSQIFLSVLKHRSQLEVVLPVNPDSIGSMANAHDLRGKGHHGVGDVQISLRDERDLDRFLTNFGYWLTPRASAPTD
ncbi:hypothetical protein [Isoptericola sp. NPDC057391]|uniref:hypothetical protein n=1 Tax=Isoptericola sp. NPDC057391 TaxID=3346117 RepID=UPI003631B495